MLSNRKKKKAKKTAERLGVGGKEEIPHP